MQQVSKCKALPSIVCRLPIVASRGRSHHEAEAAVDVKLTETWIFGPFHRLKVRLLVVGLPKLFLGREGGCLEFHHDVQGRVGCVTMVTVDRQERDEKC